jgi:hypothetical protein
LGQNGIQWIEVLKTITGFVCLIYVVAALINIYADDAAMQLLTDKGYDPVYGARPLKRVIQRDQVSKNRWF